jgi:hypothetical protein
LIWSSAFGEYFPTEDAEAPDVAEGGILAVVQRFGCGPFNRNLKLKFLLAGGKIELNHLIKLAKELGCFFCWFHYLQLFKDEVIAFQLIFVKVNLNL